MDDFTKLLNNPNWQAFWRDLDDDGHAKDCGGDVFPGCNCDLFMLLEIRQLLGHEYVEDTHRLRRELLDHRKSRRQAPLYFHE